MKMPGLACLLPRTAIAVAGLVLFLAGPALAQGTDQGTEEERRACTPDVMRLCREFIPNVAAITQCLIDRRAELNPACKLVMTPKPDPVKQATAAKKRPATRRTAKPTPTARTVSSEPGDVMRPPMNIVPPGAAAKPAKKKARPASARSAAVAPAPAQKKPAATTP